MRVYISIPMSGQDLDVQRRKAQELADTMASMGHVPINPFDTPPPPPGLEPQEEYNWYMGEDIKRLLSCHAIFVCKGYRSSKGCTAELRVAKVYGLHVYTSLKALEALVPHISKYRTDNYFII